MIEKMRRLVYQANWSEPMMAVMIDTTDQSTPKTRWPIDLIGFAIIALIALKLMVWVDRAVDLTIADEARYLYQGVKLLEVGFPSPQWAPLYSIWYFLLNAVLPASGNIQLYYASFVLLSTAIPLMIYGYLRQVAVAPIVALLGALFFLVSYSNLNIRPYPAKFAQFWVLIFLLASTVRASAFARPAHDDRAANFRFHPP